MRRRRGSTRARARDARRPRSCCRAGPVLVAIDDVQWVDASSAAALAFALRRLATERVILLLARRFLDGAPPSPIEEALDAESVRRLEVEPLSVGALHTLLSSRLGRPFARQTLLRIHEQSGGNPFFAIELARVLDPGLDPAQPLVVPDTLEGLLRGRITALPVPTREALAFAAAIGNPSESLLRRAGVGAEALDPAVATHVIERADGTIRFTHPLLSSVLYGDLGEARRSIHGRIADVVDDPVERARHLALSTAEPDTDVAAVVDGPPPSQAIAAPRGRGGARRAGTPAHTRGRRAMTVTAGHSPLLACIMRPGSGRAHGRSRPDCLSRMSIVARRCRRASRRAGRSRPFGRAAPGSAARNDASPGAVGDPHAPRVGQALRGSGLEHARLASELADGLGDDVLQSSRTSRAGRPGLVRRRSQAPPDLPVHMHAFAAAVGGGQLVQEATLAVVNTLARLDEEGRGSRIARARAPGVSGARRAAERAGALGPGMGRVLGRTLEARGRARRSRPRPPDPVRARGSAEPPPGRAHRRPPWRPRARARALGASSPPRGGAVHASPSAAHGDSRARRALERRSLRGRDVVREGRAAREGVRVARAEPPLVDGATTSSSCWSSPASTRPTASSRRGRRTRSASDREWVLAHATRCRGLAAAADGDLARRRVVPRAGGRAARSPRRSATAAARALLALGVVRRRAAAEASRRGRDRARRSKASSSSAPATWSEQARSEIGRIGGRRREEGLTPAERRVAPSSPPAGRTARSPRRFPRRADRRESPDAHLRQARRPLADRARAPAARRREQSSDVLTFPPQRPRP